MKMFTTFFTVCLAWLLLISPVSNADNWGWTEVGSMDWGIVKGGVVKDQSFLIVTFNDQSAQFYRSDDQCNTWELVHAILNIEPYSLVQSNDDILFLSAKNIGAFSGQVYRSSTFGDEWDACALFQDDSIPMPLLVHSDNSLLVGCFRFYPEGCQFYQSEDNGGSWILKSTFPEVVFYIWTLSETVTGNVIAGVSELAEEAAIYESVDHGDSWIKNNMSPNVTFPHFSYIETSNETRYLASSDGNNEIFKRDWNEDGWTLQSEIPLMLTINYVHYSSQDVWYAGVNPIHHDRSVIYESSDNGETWTEMFMNSYPTEALAMLEADDGYLYALCRPGVYRSEAPIIPPTPTCTVGPGTPTNTPLPPTLTPTPRPSTPTFTPTPGPTSTPPCEELGVTLDYPSTHFTEGDLFYLNVVFCNNTRYPLTEYPLFIILEIEGSFFFAPAWNGEYAYYEQDWPIGVSEKSIIVPFAWPSNAGSFSGAVIYGALTNRSVTQIFGRYDSWEFGWDS